MLETKSRKYLREGCNWLAKEHEEPPSNGGRDGETGQAAQRRKSDLDRARQPASSGLRQPHAGRVLNLIKKNKILFQTIFPPTTHYFSS
jgi:hypothetical protein